MLQLATQVLAVWVFWNVLGGLWSGELGQEAPSVWAVGLCPSSGARGTRLVAVPYHAVLCPSGGVQLKRRANVTPAAQTPPCRPQCSRGCMMSV